MEQNKIEKLEQYTSSIDGIHAVFHPDKMDIVRKINELVDVVNELREELNKRKDNAEVH